ncbi:unnamed protein product [Pleuronectes platessa]|uniref:Uncharacterized protein n=1 Tax=Pleuronectes platessa TaxID=8262 RepID=A0A9N7Z2N6_PLEPL|nr:unnamed protein product [Pleuronectes platessa]
MDQSGFQQETWFPSSQLFIDTTSINPDETDVKSNICNRTKEQVTTWLQVEFNLVNFHISPGGWIPTSQSQDSSSEPHGPNVHQPDAQRQWKTNISTSRRNVPPGRSGEILRQRKQAESFCNEGQRANVSNGRRRKTSLLEEMQKSRASIVARLDKLKEEEQGPHGSKEGTSSLVEATEELLNTNLQEEAAGEEDDGETCDFKIVFHQISVFVPEGGLRLSLVRFRSLTWSCETE